MEKVLSKQLGSAINYCGKISYLPKKLGTFILSCAFEAKMDSTIIMTCIV